MAGVSVGQVYGWWTVMQRAETDDPRDRRWLCQCRCGTQRSVLERSLRYGGSTNCGCRRREGQPRQQLTGQVFGQLTVIRYQKDAVRSRWLCRCSCGKECRCTTSQLISGEKTHCGCQTPRQGRISDLSGRRFDRLVAVEPLNTRDAKGSVMWRCRCDCGSEVEVSCNMLMYGNMRSCGCKKREHDAALNGYLQHVDGTSIDMLKSSKIPCNNTTGVKGVYRSRGKYIAKIVIQGHQYHLGAYSTMEEAAAARQEAEETVNQQLIRAWERWRARADQDAAWAEENPFTIRVEKDGQNRLSLKIGGI